MVSWSSVNFYKLLFVELFFRNGLRLALFFAVMAGATQVKLDCNGFVDAALSNDPQVYETSLGLESKRIKLDQIVADAIMPKFQVEMAFGPAPGLKRVVENAGDTVNAWDFSKIGPYFGTQIDAAQPLNLGQLRTGLRTARADLEQKQWEIQGSRIQKAAEYQRYYYGFLLAIEMHRIANEASENFQKAQDRLQAKLDSAEDDEDSGKKSVVSQDDLLMLKAGRFEVDKAVADAESGLQKAELAIRFSLRLAETDTFATKDSSLIERPELLPPLDTLKRWLKSVNPDMQRMHAGMNALEGQVRLAEEGMGPQFFIFGSFTYAKSWAGDRRALSSNAFAQDPVNTLTGSLGIGLRYNLNYWSALQKVRLAKADFRQLKAKDNYALDGLLLQLEVQYSEFIASRNKLESARKSLRATEALLKGAAMRFDVDPSESTKLIEAYKRDILMQKDFYFALYDYNVSVANLLAKIGIGPAEIPRSSL